jgi:biotin carboxyl carrier protein
MRKKLRVSVDGKQYEVIVEMDDEPAVAGPATSSVGPLGPVSVASVAAPAPLAAPPTSSSASAAAATAGPGDVPSPLAGRVTAVNVEAGQEVKEGDHLLTLEAMKMNTFVMAPRAGKVKEVKAAVGTAVEEGQALVTLE